MHKHNNILEIFILLILLPVSFSEIEIPLAGDGWILEDSDGMISIATKVPTDVHTSLFNATLIPDPYVNENDKVFRNISWKNWTLSRQFSLPSALSRFKTIIFKVSSVDTIATIFVNKNKVGNTNNMFRTFVFDIQDFVHFDNTTRNNLTIKFSSPLSYVLHQAADYKAKYGYSIPVDCQPIWFHGECHKNFIRKTQSSFSWDFAPSFPTMGIYDNNLSLLAFDTCTILQFSVVPTMAIGRKYWILNVDFILYCAQNLTTVEFFIFIDEISFRYSWNDFVHIGTNRIQNSSKIAVNSVEKWWPNGFGTQKLYNVTGSFQTLNEMDSRSLKIGFRTAELVQEPITNFTQGLTFYFRINEVPIFLKGANWIPADSFIDRVTSDRLQFYFSSMKEAHFNTVRVNGIGMYETEEFYDLADRTGLMIFQEMIFANDLYPTNEEFLDNVRQEIYEQINRLKHRPSIILWSGNNENEIGMVHGWYKMDAPFDVYKKDYVKLYNDTIYEIINETDYFSRPYVMSSPSNGLNTTRSGGIDTDPYSTMYGDLHFYIRSEEDWNPKTYPVPRCITEYGSQSFPSVETMLSALSENELNFFGGEILHRQRGWGTQLQILEDLSVHFDLSFCNEDQPKQNNPSSYYSTKNYLQYKGHLKKKHCTKQGGRKFFEKIVFLTQIHQAMVYKTETEHYRRWRSSINKTSGEGHTMCALYWVLNDIWQAPALSSIDYGMKWKMVHYYAKKFFAPVLVSPFVEGGKLKVSVISDLLQPLTNATLIIDIHSWQSFLPIFSYQVSLKHIPPSSASIVFETNMSNPFDKIIPKRTWFFITKIFVNNVSVSENILFQNSFKQVPKGHVTVEKVEGTADQHLFLITLKATGPAPFVWLDVKNITGWFSDNGFAMLTRYQQVSFQIWQRKVLVPDIEANLNVMSLKDLY